MAERTHQAALELLRLTDEQWALWRDVRLRALGEAPDAFSSTLAEWQGPGDREERWRRRLTDVPLNVVAVAGGLPLGQVSGTALDEKGRCTLMSLWVTSAARGRGVGEALVGEVVGWATGLGASAVVLSVRAENAHAIRLYQRTGFAQTDEPAEGSCEVTMQRPLR